MLQFGLNNMTIPRCSVSELLAVARKVGCVGVEFRNDLEQPMFGDQSPEAVGELFADHGVRILALAEVKAFNDPDVDLHADALDLIKMAAACGAEGVALIPKMMTLDVPRNIQREALKKSLMKLRLLLEKHDQIGLIEPLGFRASSLRFKDDIAAVLDEMQRPKCFRILHDTFHHSLAETDSIHAELTALVHISGVTDEDLRLDDMTDAHRVLVGQGDRLGNIAQLMALRNAGFSGPASFEAFAPEIHDLTDPASALAGSINFIETQMTSELA
jgi:2-keto-myo-inositol isomerase